MRSILTHCARRPLHAARLLQAARLPPPPHARSSVSPFQQQQQHGARCLSYSSAFADDDASLAFHTQRRQGHEPTEVTPLLPSQWLRVVRTRERA
jgi:hypothetical protein